MPTLLHRRRTLVRAMKPPAVGGSSPTWIKTDDEIAAAASFPNFYDFTVDINNSSSSDEIVVLLSHNNGNITGVTINGDAMTNVCKSNAANPTQASTAVWKSTGHTYTTATVRVSFTGLLLIGITIGYLSGFATGQVASALKEPDYNPDPQETDTSMTTVAGDLALAVLMSAADISGASWTNMTIESNLHITSGGFSMTHTTAKVLPSAGAFKPSCGGGFAYTGTQMAAATWRP